jgi:hypothetical protein
MEDLDRPIAILDRPIAILDRPIATLDRAIRVWRVEAEPWRLGLRSETQAAEVAFAGDDGAGDGAPLDIPGPESALVFGEPLCAVLVVGAVAGEPTGELASGRHPANFIESGGGEAAVFEGGEGELSGFGAGDLVEAVDEGLEDHRDLWSAGASEVAHHVGADLGVVAFE